MGRLPPGQKPTPHKVRLTKYRQELETSGGHRLIADIEKPANEALRAILELDDPPGEGRELTKKDAVSRALMHYAKSLQRRKR